MQVYLLDVEAGPEGLHLFGSDTDGASVCATVRNVVAHIYVDWPFADRSDGAAATLRGVLDVDEDDLWVTFEQRTRLMGYVPDAATGDPCKSWYARLHATDYRLLRRVGRAMQWKAEALCRAFGVAARPLSTYNHEVGLEQHFFCARNVAPATWIALHGTTPVTTARASTCAREVVVPCDGVQPSSNDDPPPDMTVLSFDIETGFHDLSRRCGSFPQLHSPCSAVTYIGASCQGSSTGTTTRATVLALAPDDAVHAALSSTPDVQPFRTEPELLNAFGALLAAADPSFVTGYNIWGFDWEFLAKRAEYFELFGNMADAGAAAAAYREAQQRRSALDGLARHSPSAGVPPAARERLRQCGVFAAKTVEEAKRKLAKLGGGCRMGRATELGQTDALLLRYASEAAVAAAYAHFGTYDGDMEAFWRCSRLVGHRARLAESKTESSAHGQFFQRRVDLPGRVTLDLYKLVKETYKLSSYKLRDVATHFGVTQGKIDLPYETMFQHHCANDPDKAKAICAYCLRDTAVPLEVLRRIDAVLNVLELASTTGVPARQLLVRGQQLRCYTQLHALAESRGMVMNVRTTPDRETFQGATVQEPRCGYIQGVILYLDFASLYPSIIQSFNLDYSTYVFESDRPAVEALERAGKLALLRVKGSGGFTHVFVRPEGARRHGVMPHLLTNLLDARKAAKRDLKAAKRAGGDDARVRVLDARQLSLKICANSCYGFTGVTSDKAMLPLCAIADSTTALGRQLIEDTKQAVLGHPLGAHLSCVYGDTDSVLFEAHTNDIRQGWAWGKTLEAWLNDTVLPPIGHKLSIELEEVAWGYLQYKKKRYTGRMYPEGPDGKCKVEVKGIELARTDQTNVLLRIYQGLLDQLFPTDPAAPPYPPDVLRRRCHAYMQRALADMVDSTAASFTVSDYAFSKQMRADYKNPNLPHVDMVRRLRDKVRRGEAPNVEVPQPGDRCRYVFVSGVGQLYKRSEHPALCTLAELDMEYYLGAIKKPLTECLQWFMEPAAIAALFAVPEGVLARRKMGAKSLLTYFGGGTEASVAHAASAHAAPPPPVPPTPTKKARRQSTLTF